MYNYLIYFLVFSFLGWCLEVVFAYFKNGRFVNRGLIKGPFCPIYGVGISLSVLLLREVKSFILLALFSMAIATIVEYLAGAFSDKKLGKRLWDYTSEVGNIQGYVCPRFSVIWGVVCACVIKLIPLFDRLIDTTRTGVWYAVSFALLIAVVLDVKMSIIDKPENKKQIHVI